MKNYLNHLWKNIGPLLSYWVVSHPWIKRLISFFLGIFPDVKDMIRRQMYGFDEYTPGSMKRDVNLTSPETREIYQDLMVAMQNQAQDHGAKAFE